MHGVAGYSARECAAGVLLWNTPAPVGGRAQEEATVAVTMRNVPFSRFTIEAYIIDDRRHPSVSQPCSAPLALHGSVGRWFGLCAVQGSRDVRWFLCRAGTTTRLP